MAGDWLKIQHALPDKPEVVQMAKILGIDQDAVTGKLLRLWIWADQQSVNGDALSVTESFLDRHVFQTGFASALRTVGWLEGEELSLTLPNFGRHNGKTAKSRALTKDRMEALRSDRHKKHTGASPEKRREEKRREETQYKSGTLSEDNEPDRPVVMEFPTKGKNAKPFKLRQDKFDEYLEAFPAVDVAQELRNALQWLRDNPAKAKTERGMLAFLTRWLTRVQNSGGSRNGREQNGGGYRHAAEAREAANASAFDHVRSLIANNAGST